MKCLFFLVHLFTMLTLQPNAWAPGTSQLMSGQHSELLVSLVSEMVLTDACQHNTAIIRAGPSQTTCWRASSRWETNLGSMVPNASTGLRDPSTRSKKQIVATFRDQTNEDKSTNGCVKPFFDSERKHTQKSCAAFCRKRPADLHRGIPHPNEVNARQATTSSVEHRGGSPVLVEKRKRDEMNPFDAVISAGVPFIVLDLEHPTTKLSACLDTAMFDVCISFSRQPTCSGKRFVSGSLATPEGNADVTSTESHRFRRSTLGKATDAPSSE